MRVFDLTDSSDIGDDLPPRERRKVAVHVVMARKDGETQFQPMGIAVEGRAARRAARALELGPTGYAEAYVTPKMTWTHPQALTGMAEGFALVDAEVRAKRDKDYAANNARAAERRRCA